MLRMNKGMLNRYPFIFGVNFSKKKSIRVSAPLFCKLFLSIVSFVIFEKNLTEIQNEIYIPVIPLGTPIHRYSNYHPLGKPEAAPNSLLFKCKFP